MLSFELVSAIAMAARKPAPPPPTSKTSCVGVTAWLPRSHYRVPCGTREGDEQPLGRTLLSSRIGLDLAPRFSLFCGQ